ncbi:two-component sensor histidine kinase [Devosia sp. UYZn731]|uniref:sensor histidine kinase n=1 Tax=Devosia sp. UYZn731 TaxID=3156345 RepID=UPI003394ED68
MANLSPPADTSSLVLAIVISSNAPIILLDRDINVVAASSSFCLAFDLDCEHAAGKHLSELGAGEWSLPQLISGLMAAGSGKSTIKDYAMTLKRDGVEDRHLVIEAYRLDYGKDEDVRIMLSVVDATDTKRAERIKDDLLHDKAVLLQELQHRVANSLQIIASVLMQSAMSTHSDEKRGHLNDAHDRVMSVANLQRHLAVSQVDDVELRSYFNDLCRSIGASMIRERDLISIGVSCDDSTTTPEQSVSLGLIVTELVINGLKHAFPARRKGKIAVEYHSSAQEWTLIVRDDGIGMPKAGKSSEAGLGTSIVEALARQLRADIQVSNTRPGTQVSIEYRDVGDVKHRPRLALAAV